VFRWIGAFAGDADLREQPDGFPKSNVIAHRVEGVFPGVRDRLCHLGRVGLFRYQFDNVFPASRYRERAKSDVSHNGVLICDGRGGITARETFGALPKNC
jgi:hypothetical protein